MTAADLQQVEAIAERVHPLYPESGAVPAERLRLFPAGCLMAEEAGGAALGYLLSHPWLIGRAPALDSLLDTLPERADCLYLHDVALLPEARGSGLGAQAVGRLLDLARARGLAAIALVAVSGTGPYWSRHGFHPHPPGPELRAKLASYGEGAAYLVRGA